MTTKRTKSKKQPEGVRIPTYAFGYTFTHIPEHVRQDVDSLDRESALYADHWIEELNDFRHVRIVLSPEEAKDYARRSWAYELWIRAGQPKWAREVPGIDADIAHDADTYSLRSKDGTVMPPPYHCFAAFLGHDLEAIACGMQPGRQEIIELQGRESVLFTLARAVEALTPTLRSFANREKGLSPWPIKREDDIRDLLFVMLRPILFDLVKEEPTPSLAGTYKFVDLCSKASRIFIEVKWVGRRHQWKSILQEIQVDIQSYPTHESCQTLAFIVVDTVRDIPDPRLLEREFTRKQVIKDRTVDVRLYIVEP
jgi:hypothetical protein